MSGRDFEIPVAASQAMLPLPGERIEGVRIGELVGFMDDGVTPLVIYPGQPGSAAIAARMIPGLRGADIGRQVVLMFDAGAPTQPIIMGCLQAQRSWPSADELAEQPEQVAVEADGQRLVVSAREEIVLRCGQASITLTRAGKVLIKGTYLLSRSSGVNRIKGGSIQLN